MTLVVNLFAGPGSGKSTTAFGLMHLLKAKGVSVEFAHEWIKHPVWQGRTDMPQYYVWAKQQKLIDGLTGKVDVIVTDSPTLLSLAYGEKEPREFHKMVVRKFFDNRRLNVYVDRVKGFFEGGRYQTEEEARAVDVTVHDMLHGNNEYLYPQTVMHIHVPGAEGSPAILADEVLRLIQ